MLLHGNYHVKRSCVTQLRKRLLRSRSCHTLTDRPVPWARSQTGPRARLKDRAHGTVAWH